MKKVTNKEIQDISKIFKLDGLIEVDEYCRIIDMLPEEEAYKMREIMKDILMYIKNKDTFEHHLMEIVETIH